MQQVLTEAVSVYLKEFFASLGGKYIDVDGAGSKTNKNQCVDVIKAYCNRVFGVSVSSMNGYGDAWQYYDNFNLKSALTPHFTRVAYKSGMRPRAGDMVVWERSVNSSSAGHIAVASGESDAKTFVSFDQNWPSGRPCGFVTHSYNKVKGFLRPKDYGKVLGLTELCGTGSFPTPVNWKNGKTKETVFKDNSLAEEIGSLSPYESALCYSKSGSSYVVVYKLNGTSKHKAGFVEYAGGVAKAPPESKTYKNGSTPETVFADTAKKLKVGSLEARETCYCLGKTDGMYLVLYNAGSKQKCGFVEYGGSVD